jgi:hypothetical protein
MTKKWIAINLLLLAVTGLLARQLYVSVLRFYAENDLSKIQPARDLKQKTVAESPMPKLTPARIYSAAEFSIIPEKNVFSQSRSKEETVEDVTPSEPPPLAQKPILVGVMLSDTQQTASIIEQSGTSQNQNRRAQIKRIGDFYHGYKITSITSDRIVLESGTRREIIPLHEGSKRARGGKTPILSTRVVSIGSGAAGGGIAVSTVPGGTSTARTATPATVPVAATPGQQAGGQTATTPARQAPVAVQQQPQVQATQQQAPSTGGTDTQGQRVIRTPFGTIVRPARKD